MLFCEPGCKHKGEDNLFTNVWYCCRVFFVLTASHDLENLIFIVQSFAQSLIVQGAWPSILVEHENITILNSQLNACVVSKIMIPSFCPRLWLVMEEAKFPFSLLLKKGIKRSKEVTFDQFLLCYMPSVNISKFCL